MSHDAPTTLDALPLRLADAIELADLLSQFPFECPELTDRLPREERDNASQFVVEGIEGDFVGRALIIKAKSLGFVKEAAAVSDYYELAAKYRVGEFVLGTPQTRKAFKAQNLAQEELRLAIEAAWPRDSYAWTQFRVTQEREGELVEIPESSNAPIERVEAILRHGVEVAFKLIFWSRADAPPKNAWHDVDYQPTGADTMDQKNFMRCAATLGWANRKISELQRELFFAKRKPLPITPGLSVGRFVHNHAVGLAATVINYVEHQVIFGHVSAGLLVNDLSMAIAGTDPRLETWRQRTWQTFRESLPPPQDWPAWQVLRDRDIVLARLGVELQHLIDVSPPADSPLDALRIHPKSYLLKWQEILDVLGYKNTKEHRLKVRRLNESMKHPGPIILPKQGGQPKVEKGKLLNWWASLEEKFEESVNRQRNSAATVTDTYKYGRDGEVVPEIAGSVKVRRGKRS
jgi:hypothetical protein